jgi:hypothetical protein
LFSVFSGPFIFKGAIFAKVPFLQRCHFCKVPLFVCSTVCFRFFGFKLFVLGGSQLFLYFFQLFMLFCWFTCVVGPSHKMHFFAVARFGLSQ